MPRFDPQRAYSAGDSGMDYSTMWIPTTDGQLLHAWLVRCPESPELAPTVVYYHGNAGNVGVRLPNVRLMVALIKVNVLLVDYRGYGSSSGTPDEQGLGLDAEAVLDALSWRTDIDHNKIVLFGRSLGGAVAIESANSTAHSTAETPAEYAAHVKRFASSAAGEAAAAKASASRSEDIAVQGTDRTPPSIPQQHVGPRKPLWIRAVVVENTFSSIRAMVEQLFPWWVQALRPLVQKIHFPSDERVRTLTVPLLFLSSEKDPLIPTRHMRLLHDAADHSSDRRFYLIAGAGHNDAWQTGGVAYYAQWRNFISDACGYTLPEVDEAIKRVLGAGLETGAGKVETGANGAGSDLLGEDGDDGRAATSSAIRQRRPASGSGKDEL